MHFGSRYRLPFASVRSPSLSVSRLSSEISLVHQETRVLLHLLLLRDNVALHALESSSTRTPDDGVNASDPRPFLNLARRASRDGLSTVQPLPFRTLAGSS